MVAQVGSLCGRWQSAARANGAARACTHWSPWVPSIRCAVERVVNKINSEHTEESASEWALPHLPRRHPCHAGETSICGLVCWPAAWMWLSWLERPQLSRAASLCDQQLQLST